MFAQLYPVLPIVAAALFLAAIAAPVLAPRRVVDPARLWPLPLAASVLFLGWTLHAVAAGGLAGVWDAHVRSAWGNQVWFDLLIAIAIGWTLLLPRARAVGMNPWPWLALICTTGCIGLAAMFARCRYLETRQTN